MRKTYSLLLLLFIVVLTLQSCSKGGTPTPETPEETFAPERYFVSRITTKMGYSRTNVEEFVYDDKKRLSEYRFRDSLQSVYESYRYTYDDQNRVVKSAYFTFNGAPGEVKLYSYNSDITTPTKAYPTTTDDGKAAYLWPVSLTATNQIVFLGDLGMCSYNALGQTVYFGAPTLFDPAYAYPVSYDNKNNPFKNVIGINPHYTCFINNFPTNTINNRLSLKFSGGVQLNLTYNGADFPKSAWYTDDTGFKHTITYEYAIK